MKLKELQEALVGDLVSFAKQKVNNKKAKKQFDKILKQKVVLELEPEEDMPNFKPLKKKKSIKKK